MKIGLMGCGVVAGYGHLPAIKATSGLELHAIFDPNVERLRTAQEKFSVPNAFTDSNKFFESGLDAVVITSPAPVHKQNVFDAANHRLPVLCEKPLAMDEAESQAMIDRMRQVGQPLYVAFVMRFSPAATYIKQAILNGAIGQVRDLRLIYNWDCHGQCSPRCSGQINERRRGRMLEGGPLVDCGVHDIDLARWWLGSEVNRFRSFGVWLENYDAPDHLYLHMDHESGAHSMVEISFSYGHTAKEPRNEYAHDIIGTAGVIRYDRNSKTFDLRTADGTTNLGWQQEKSFETMYQQFERALRTGNAGDLPSGEDGLIATRIARQATEQAMQDRNRHR